MNNTSPLEIPFSKLKIAKFLIFSLLFLLAGLWLIRANPQTSNPVFNNILIKSLAAYGGILMGLFGIYFFTKKLFDKRSGLIIDGQGITDNSSALPKGFIPWSNISEIFEKTIQATMFSKQRFVVIVVHNPEASNMIDFNTYVHISVNGLAIKHADLLQLLQESLKKYKQLA